MGFNQSLFHICLKTSEIKEAGNTMAYTFFLIKFADTLQA